MKFAHLADVHIGAWRDSRMKELAIEAFEKTILEVIEEKVSFVLIAGDLFNTSIPPLDQVKRALASLKQLKKANIPVYAIAGSHDYSASGKTMLDILEEAELIKLVTKGSVDENNKLHLKFTEDPETKIKITGILGRKGALDKHYYEDLSREELEQTEGKKIFMFHCALNELKPKELEKMEANPSSMMPKNFDYYAGGHVHITEECSLEGYKAIVYPGPLFPASFSEIEKLGSGFYCLVEENDEDKFVMVRKPVIIKESLTLKIDADKKTVEKINSELLDLIDKNDFENKIVLLRIGGKIIEGRLSDIKLKEFSEQIYSKKAYFVMRNTNKLITPEFEDISISHEGDVEAKLIEEHAGKFPINNLNLQSEKELTKNILDTLGEPQNEGEKKYEYEDRIKQVAKELLE